MSSAFGFLPADFHFLRPEWFYALIPLALMLWVVYRWRRTATGWQGVIAGHLYQYLVTGQHTAKSNTLVSWLALAWLLTVIALAGPSWERIPQPVFQVKAGHVIVMDMSLSMRSTDVTPDRLSRAKYKAIDLVKLINEGDMGLVAYAGDAFTISPLTEDATTLTALLPSLSPEIMPTSGSEPILGLKAAANLLESAGYQRGALYWITDGVELEQMKELSDFLSSTPYTVNILGVGTQTGAPIKQLNGELLKRSNGAIVIPKMNPSVLQQLSRQGGGNFSEITANDSDIRRIASVSRFDNAETESEDDNKQGDKWAEAGPYLLLLLLPIAALSFRRGLLFAICLCVLLPMQSPVAVAQTQPVSTPEVSEAPQPEAVSWWQKPFLNADQQGFEQYNSEQFQGASESFDDLSWKGAAQYRAGDFEGAAETYGQLNSAEGFYNQGNALAKAGQLEEAIAAYEQALAKRPDYPEAAENKALIEQLKNQQDQQQQDQQNQGDNQNQSDDQQNQSEQDGENQQQNGEGSDQQQDGENDPSQNGQQDSQNQQQQSSDSQQNADQNGEQSDQQDAQEEQQEQAQQPQEGEQEAGESEMKQAIQGDAERDKETEQRLNNLLRRVPDDPAFLLKRKMQLEAQKRQYRRPPSSDRSDW